MWTGEAPSGCPLTIAWRSSRGWNIALYEMLQPVKQICQIKPENYSCTGGGDAIQACTQLMIAIAVKYSKKEVKVEDLLGMRDDTLKDFDLAIIGGSSKRKLQTAAPKTKTAPKAKATTEPAEKRSKIKSRLTSKTADTAVLGMAPSTPLGPELQQPQLPPQQTAANDAATTPVLSLKSAGIKMPEFCDLHGDSSSESA